MSRVEYRKVQALVGESSFSYFPKGYATQMSIGKGDFVKVCLQEGKIIVEKT